eukprot:scaffold56520_cov51-Phaeocystis_antarctica.AAC.2
MSVPSQWVRSPLAWCHRDGDWNLGIRCQSRRMFRWRSQGQGTEHSRPAPHGNKIADKALSGAPLAGGESSLHHQSWSVDKQLNVVEFDIPMRRGAQQAVLI